MTNQNILPDPRNIRLAVLEKYGNYVSQNQYQTNGGCCGQKGGCCDQNDVILLSSIQNLYESSDVMNLPEDITSLSLGCGDPVALASLQPGETVLDLGSGGGIDCFLAARRVGESGLVIGVDMTPDMIEKARENREKIGAANVEFRLGEIEHLPVADNNVDVIISNCVINLSPDKPQVFREAFRVLKPGGRLSVSDIVTAGELPENIQRSLTAWAGCIAGAMEVKKYKAAIEAAGFIDVQITPVYWDEAGIDAALTELGPVAGFLDSSSFTKDAIYKSIFSAKVRAKKPTE